MLEAAAHAAACACRECRTKSNLAQLERDKEQLQYLRKELAAHPSDRFIVEEIDELSDRMWRLKQWIDGGSR